MCVHLTEEMDGNQGTSFIQFNIFYYDFTKSVFFPLARILFEHAEGLLIINIFQTFDDIY